MGSMRRPIPGVVFFLAAFATLQALQILLGLQYAGFLGKLAGHDALIGYLLILLQLAIVATLFTFRPLAWYLNSVLLWVYIVEQVISIPFSEVPFGLLGAIIGLLLLRRFWSPAIEEAYGVREVAPGGAPTRAKRIQEAVPSPSGTKTSPQSAVGVHEGARTCPFDPSEVPDASVPSPGPEPVPSPELPQPLALGQGNNPGIPPTSARRSPGVSVVRGQSRAERPLRSKAAPPISAPPRRAAPGPITPSKESRPFRRPEQPVRSSPPPQSEAEAPAPQPPPAPIPPAPQVAAPAPPPQSEAETAILQPPPVPASPSPTEAVPVPPPMPRSPGAPSDAQPPAAATPAAEPPAGVPPQFFAGVEAGRAGDWAKAIQAYRESLRLAPEHAEAWFNLGVAYEKHSQPGQAMEAYSEAVRVHPDYAEAWYNLGLVREYVGLKPHDAILQRDRMWMALAIAHRTEGKPAEALPVAREVVRLKPVEARAWKLLAAIHNDLGQHAEALDALREAVRVGPKDAEAWMMLGAECRRSGRQEEADAAFREADRLMANDRQKGSGGIEETDGNSG